MLWFGIILVLISLFLIIFLSKYLNRKKVIIIRTCGIIFLIIGLFLLAKTTYLENYIEITLPSNLVEDISQEDLNRDVKEDIYKTATLNNDGSITYKMTKKQHRKYLMDLEVLYDDSINEMIDEEDNIIKITRNDNFSSFKVIINSNKLPNSKNLINNNLFYMGQIYAIYSESEVKKITIKYYDNSSKKIIEENKIDIN